MKALSLQEVKTCSRSYSYVKDKIGLKFRLLEAKPYATGLVQNLLENGLQGKVFQQHHHP